MSSRVATIVRCCDLVRFVHSTVESIERQTAGPGEIVLVTDELMPGAADAWLQSVASRRGLRLVRAASPQPGAVRNAGIRATASPYVMCVDAGDGLDPRFHEIAVARLEADPTVDLITSGVQILGPGSDTRTVAPAGVDLDTLIGDAEAIHGASVFRRWAWESLGPFDETLPSLEHYEFWLRLLHAGRGAALLREPLLLRVLREDALYRRAWERERHVEAIGRIVERHAAIFARDPARTLDPRERALLQLGDEYRMLVRRRDEDVRELEALKARAGELRRALPEAERDAIDLGDLRRATPVARDWGFERGLPIDRYYIERFLEQHSDDVKGAVLELQGSEYAERFGGERLTRCDVVDIDPSNRRATFVSDLRSAANIASDTYDCIILTQTLHLIDDVRAVLSECARILRPGGVLLATLPCASRVSLEYGRDGDFWRITEAGARHLFSAIFPADALEVHARGNVLVNTAFLYGLACHELTEAEFEASDPYFPLLITVRAQKEGAAVKEGPAAKEGPAKAAHHVRGVRFQADPPDAGSNRAAILLYHRVANVSSDVHRLAVAPDEFRTQMEHLRRCYRPMPLLDLAVAARENRIPPRSVAITFDDGYRDNFTEASRILSELQIPATFFITTDRLNEEYEYWWDRLERILLSGDTPILPKLHVALPDGARTFDTSTAAARQAAHTAVYHAIVGASAHVRDEVLRALATWSRPSRDGLPHRRMTPDEIRSLASREGHTIGAHTARHLMLPRQPIDVQRREIHESQCALELLVSRPVRAFAYPFGAFSDETVSAVAAASFDVAVTCEDALVGARPPPLTLPRLDVVSRPIADFAEWLESRFSARSAAS